LFYFRGGEKNKNDCNLLLCLTTKHVSENFGGGNCPVDAMVARLVARALCALQMGQQVKHQLHALYVTLIKQAFNDTQSALVSYSKRLNLAAKRTTTK